MSDEQVGGAQRLVITAGEIERLNTGATPQPPPAPASGVPWWGITIGLALVLCLPLLCVFAGAIRLSLRRRDGPQRAWTALLCTLLICSGLLTSVAGVYSWFLKAPPRQPAGQLPLGLVSHDLADTFPALPTATPMTPVEIAARTKLLVFIVTPDPAIALGESGGATALGAAVLLMADDSGYLLATNRHVTDPPFLFRKGANDRVLAISSEGSYAYADVVARHQKLDLALLWVSRRNGHTNFRQPITPYSKVAVGSPVFVIGHPQGLFFTLSSGLVSRVGGDDIVQLSAPISPGNSGGPAYDSLGNLIGVVTFTVDKQSNPNAENLNFATRADAFLSEAGWNFREGGKAKLKKFLESSLGGQPSYGVH